MSERATEDRAPGIRGPELRAPGAIARQIASQERGALSDYAQGMLTLLRAWQLLDAERRLGALRQERAFQLHRLEQLEKRHPSAVAAALARAAQQAPIGAAANRGPLAQCIHALRRAAGAPELDALAGGAGAASGDEGEDENDATHDR